MKLKELNETIITKSKAETKFLFGGCGSFAIALQQLVGGDIFILSRKNQKLHAFVKVDNKNIDVKGIRSTTKMALGITGSLDDWKIEGPFTKNEIPFKITDNDIKISLEYIKNNPKQFGLNN